MRKAILVAALVSAVFIPVVSAYQDDWKKQEKDWQKQQEKEYKEQKKAEDKAWKEYTKQDKKKGPDRYYYRIPPADAGFFVEYYRRRPLPPGPPVQFYREGYLPPGWQRRIAPVPFAIEQRLAPLPPGYRRGILDGYYVVYDPASGLILDFWSIFGRP